MYKVIKCLSNIPMFLCLEILIYIKIRLLYKEKECTNRKIVYNQNKYSPLKGLSFISFYSYTILILYMIFLITSFLLKESRIILRGIC